MKVKENQNITSKLVITNKISYLKMNLKEQTKKYIMNIFYENKKHKSNFPASKNDLLFKF